MRPKMLEINLNQYVKFNLTDLGKEHFSKLLEKESKEFNYLKAKTLNEYIQKDGSYKIQFHEFSFSFGRAFFVGAQNYIVDNTLSIVE